ncbi:MAG: DUF4340 domain-containing protein [Planctomycetota bacterium]
MISRATTIGLLAAVLGLSALAWWQLAREEVASAEQEFALFEGLELERVTAVRVDNVARDAHFRVEREPSGRWRMTDPVAVPANGALVDFLVRTAVARRAKPVVAAEGDARSLGFEPPRVVLDIEGVTPNGPSRQRLELGALDIDGQHQYVRSNGRILRTTRDLDSTLDRSVEEYKANHALELDVRRVVEVHRRGSLALDGGPPLDLAFDALSEDGGWRATAPRAARLDPLALHVWIQGAARMPIRRYVEDGAAALADYGLDPPEMTITLVAVDAKESKLELGRPGHAADAAWFARIDGQSFWCAVEGAVVQALAAPLDELLDRRVCRLPVESIDGLTLRTHERELVLARAGTTWTVAEHAHDGAPRSEPVPADSARVGDLVGELSKLEFVRFAAGTAFVPLAGGARLSIHAGAETEGGVFGLVPGEDGPAALACFRRDGDDAVAFLDPIVLEWLATPIEKLLTLRVVEILEAGQARLTILGGDRRRSFDHTSKGLWTVPDLGTEARDLPPALLESLLFVRASKHRSLGVTEPLREPITVEFTDRGGNVRSYVVGLGSGGEGEAVEVEFAGRRSVLRDQRVHGQLTQLLGP